MTGLTDSQLSFLIDRFNAMVLDTLVAPATSLLPAALANIGILTPEQMALLWLQGTSNGTGMPGPMGPPGPIGPAGPPGQEGQQGVQGIQGVPGPRGLQGIVGVPGSPGVPGPMGPQGPLGPAGMPGAGVSILGTVPTSANLPAAGVMGDAWLAADTNHLWVWAAQPAPGVWQDVGVISGPPGPQGQMGPPGPQGNPGAPGAGDGTGVPVLTPNQVVFGGADGLISQDAGLQYDVTTTMLISGREPIKTRFGDGVFTINWDGNNYADDPTQPAMNYGLDIPDQEFFWLYATPPQTSPMTWQALMALSPTGLFLLGGEPELMLDAVNWPGFRTYMSGGTFAVNSTVNSNTIIDQSIAAFMFGMDTVDRFMLWNISTPPHTTANWRVLMRLDDETGLTLGGTGTVTVGRNPQADMEVATKHYVDGHAGTGPGGGIPDATSDNFAYGRMNGTWERVVPLAGNVAMTGSLALAGIPTAPTAAAATNTTQIATTAYVKSQNYLVANQSISLSGDVTGSGTTAIAALVAGLQGRPVANMAPSLNQVLQWSGSQWQPGTVTTGGDGGVPTLTPTLIVYGGASGAIAQSPNLTFDVNNALRIGQSPSIVRLFRGSRFNATDPQGHITVNVAANPATTSWIPDSTAQSMFDLSMYQAEGTYHFTWAPAAATPVWQTLASLTPTGWDMQAKKIANVADPTLDQDVATKAYADTRPGPQGPPGTPGAPGAAGADGATGPMGPAGPGVPPAGLLGQVLTKNSAADFDTAWQTPTGGPGGGIPEPTGTGVYLRQIGSWVGGYRDTGGDLWGNIVFRGTNPRIMGDMSGSPRAGRLTFQSTVGNVSNLQVMPPAVGGLGTYITAYASTNIDNSPYIQMGLTTTAATVTSTAFGTGTVLPFTFTVGTINNLTMGTDGSVTLYKDPTAAMQAATQQYVLARAIPTGGAVNQVLTKTGSGNFAVGWVAAPGGGVSNLAQSQVLFGKADGTIAQDAGFTFTDGTSPELMLGAGIYPGFEFHVNGGTYATNARVREDTVVDSTYSALMSGMNTHDGSFLWNAATPPHTTPTINWKVLMALNATPYAVLTVGEKPIAMRLGGGAYKINWSVDDQSLDDPAYSGMEFGMDNLSGEFFWLYAPPNQTPPITWQNLAVLDKQGRFSTNTANRCRHLVSAARMRRAAAQNLPGNAGTMVMLDTVDYDTDGMVDWGLPNAPGMRIKIAGFYNLTVNVSTTNFASGGTIYVQIVVNGTAVFEPAFTFPVNQGGTSTVWHLRASDYVQLRIYVIGAAVTVPAITPTMLSMVYLGEPPTPL